MATSYAAGDKFFIDPYKLLPMDRFLPQPKGAASPGRGELTATACRVAGNTARGIPCKCKGGLLLELLELLFTQRCRLSAVMQRE